MPEDSALPDEQTADAAAAWSLSIDRADRMHPAGLVRPMLQLAAMLDPNGIPAAVLTSPPALAYLNVFKPQSVGAVLRAELRRRLRRSPPPGQPDPAQAAVLEEAAAVLRTLHRLSLIDQIPASPNRSVRIHQLIQRTVRDTLDPGQAAFCASMSAHSLLSVWPDDDFGSGLADVLRANTEVLTQHAEDALCQSDAHPVLFRAGHSLVQIGQASAARTYFGRLTDIIGNRLGPDHPDTISARANFVFARGLAGERAPAAAAFAELLPDMLRVLGPEHPGTMEVRLQCARFRGLAGEAASAAAAIAELLPDLVRVFGPADQQTVTARCNLAGLRGEAGDTAGVEAAFADLAPTLAQMLGPNPPHTITTNYGDIVLGERSDTAEVFIDLLAPDLILVHRGPGTVYDMDGNVRSGPHPFPGPIIDVGGDHTG